MQAMQTAHPMRMAAQTAPTGLQMQTMHRIPKTRLTAGLQTATQNNTGKNFTTE